jgi:hypothetical protein
VRFSIPVNGTRIWLQLWICLRGYQHGCQYIDYGQYEIFIFVFITLYVGFMACVRIYFGGYQTRILLPYMLGSK